MKIKNIVSSVVLGGFVAILAGCSKSDNSAPPPATSTPDSKPITAKAAEAVSNVVDKSKEVANQAEQKAAEVKDQAVAATQKAEQSVKDATANATSAVTGTTSAATSNATAAANGATTGATAAAAGATTGATAAASDPAQSLIDKAKSYVANKQYQPALDTLAKLKDLQLTDAQQQVVNDLKTQIQKMMASDPAGAVGGLLGK